MLNDRSFSFGDFILFADRAVLCRKEEQVRIGSRAIEILTTLVERAGTVVASEELIARTWPDTHVEENTLRVHLVSLRKALSGEGDNSQYIANVPGRGYRFVYPVKSENGTTVSTRSALPMPPRSLFGRSQDIERLQNTLHDSRLLTIVGPGGCGKTSVALAVAHSVMDLYRDGVVFVDLALVPDCIYLKEAIAQALGLPGSPETERELVCHFRNMEVLLVLDNCEHAIDKVVTFSDELLKRAPALRILTTSREAFRVRNETQYRLLPLDYSPSSKLIRNKEEALVYPSMQLFVHAALASGTAYEFTDQDVPIVAAICQYLEGIPLFIELAGAAMAWCTAAELLEELSHSLSALSCSQRSVPSRQKTVRNSIDWGFRTLSSEEQHLLLCLSTVNEPFDRIAAIRAADPTSDDSSFTLEVLAALVAKFWLIPDLMGSKTMFRLSPLTRLYLRDRLALREDAEDDLDPVSDHTGSETVPLHHSFDESPSSTIWPSNSVGDRTKNSQNGAESQKDRRDPRFSEVMVRDRSIGSRPDSVHSFSGNSHRSARQKPIGQRVAVCR